MYTKNDLLLHLKEAGLTGRETILIHSSMKSIGPVEGGADTVLDAWMEFFAGGLLLLPTHTWANVDRGEVDFDPATSQACIGILPNLFFRRPGVVRSLHPTHSMAGYGADAAEYLKGEEFTCSPCAPGGCYDRLRARGGKILLVGVTHARNTFIHCVEELLAVPRRLTDKPVRTTVLQPDGTRRVVWMRRHHNDQQPLISEDFIKLDRALEECGATRVVSFGDARCILCDAQRTFEVIRYILAPDPECIITKPEILPEQWAGFVAEA